MENKLDELCRILAGSKEYKFEYGDYGMTVLKLTNYNTGYVVRLDLGKLVEEYADIAEDLIVEDNE
jgi:hypothetical protein